MGKWFSADFHGFLENNEALLIFFAFSPASRSGREPVGAGRGLSWAPGAGVAGLAVQSSCLTLT